MAHVPTPLDWDGLARYAAQPFPHDWPTDRYAFFSPRDPGVHDVIAAVLRSCSQSCKVNMYGFDDNEVDAILHRVASSPDVHFQMSLDKSQAGGVHERLLVAPWASAVGTSVAIGTSARHAISHLKVVVVDGLYVISGSTNWSLSGEQKQDNELLVQRAATVAARYSALLDLNHVEMVRQMRLAQR